MHFTLKTVILLVLGAVAITCIVFFTLRLTNGTPTTQVDTNRASVIRQIQALERLETTSYSIEKVIEAGSTDSPVWKKILFGDRLLLIAHGKVMAGFDMATVSEKNVRVSGNKLEVTLPAPIILSTTLDNAATKVFDRQTGVLNRGNQNLESEARLAAERAIHDAACGGNILSAAAEQGKVFVTRMFTLAGFSEVTVTVPEGSCEKIENMGA